MNLGLTKLKALEACTPMPLKRGDSWHKKTRWGQNSRKCYSRKCFIKNIKKFWMEGDKWRHWIWHCIATMEATPSNDDDSLDLFTDTITKFNELCDINHDILTAISQQMSFLPICCNHYNYTHSLRS